jgi:hypothetical protein
LLKLVLSRFRFSNSCYMNFFGKIFLCFCTHQRNLNPRLSFLLLLCYENVILKFPVLSAYSRMICASLLVNGYCSGGQLWLSMVRMRRYSYSFSEHTSSKISINKDISHHKNHKNKLMDDYIFFSFRQKQRMLLEIMNRIPYIHSISTLSLWSLQYLSSSSENFR